MDVPLGGTKQRTALAALLLQQGRVLSNHQLARFLWDERPPITASAQIHTYVSRLRTQLAPHISILRQSQGYALSAAGVSIDYLDFRSLTQRANEATMKGDYLSALRNLREALKLWSGPALSNTTCFLSDEAGPELEEYRMHALESRFEVEIRLGRYAALIPELTRIVREHPYREQLRAQLMRALFLSSRQGDAMTLYHEGRRLLADELGVDPGELLARTYQGILTGKSALVP